MSSQSASPSITKFFKAQRKRPRTGKDDGIVSASKKLLLEEGIVKADGDGVGKNMVVNESVSSSGKGTDIPSSSKIVEGEASGNGNDAPSSSKSVESEATGKGTDTTSSSIIVEGEASGKGKDTPLSSIIVEGEATGKGTDTTTSKTLQGAGSGKGNDSTTSKSVESEATGKGTDTTTSKTLQGAGSGKGNDSTSSKIVESPVKFLKLGALSPAKKKLTTEQVARLLKKKNKLSDLKNALEGINQCAEKLTEFRRTVAVANAKMSPAQKINKGDPGSAGKPGSSATKATTGVSPGQFYSPSADRALKADLDRLSSTKLAASPSKLVNMNNKVKKRLFEEIASPKEGDKKVPAYQRFHNLAEKTAAEKGTVTAEEADLPLPFHFKVLKEMFIAVETVVGIMNGRKEIAIFPKVKAGVHELVRKISLREKHLAQIITVLPGCYSFSLEKVGQETHIKIEVDNLVPSVVCARRKAFHAALIKICLDHHKNFLLGLVPPIVVPADKQITRWHPNFKLDEIADIIAKEDALPVKPAPEKISSARDVIAKAQNILENANPRMKQAMKNMLNNSEVNGGQSTQPTTAAEPIKLKSATTLKSIKGVSQSLLEKIRNREREKLLNEMTRSPADSKKLQMMKRLPNFIKIIRNMIVAEKKVALPLDIVINRASHSIQNMSGGDTDAHVRLLVTLLPNWIKIVKLSRSDMEYLKIDKTVDINGLLLEMDEIIKKHASM